ncbi:MAG: hypothetical protein ACOH5I_12615 [Oligoflexus sp.]
MRILGSIACSLVFFACSHQSAERKSELEPTVTLRVGEFFDADWKSYGFYDDSGSFEHQYGGPDSGYYAYHFGVDENEIGSLIVRARLSAESADKGRPHEISEVTVVVNDVEVGTQRVQPDDQKGQVYEWIIDQEGVLQRLNLQTEPTNVLKFVVKDDAKARHGLCLYGESLENEGEGHFIEITAVPKLR